MVRKRNVILGLLGLGTLGIGVFCKLKHPSKYSYDWIIKLTDEEWDTEREYIRKDIFCNPNLSTKVREEAHRLLDLFDKVWRDKHNTGEIGFPVHREHGWYLNKD